MCALSVFMIDRDPLGRPVSINRLWARESAARDEADARQASLTIMTLRRRSAFDFGKITLLDL